MRCVRCGREIPSQSRFCLVCGSPVPAAAPQPAPAYAPAPPVAPAYAAAARRPVWPLLLCIGVILALVVGLAIFWRIRSLATAQQRDQSGGSMVVAPSSRGSGGDFTRTSPPQLNASPFTPAPRQPPANPTVAPRPGETRMPPDVLAYLRWLAQVDTTRSEMESQAEAEVPGLLADLMTGGLGMDVDEVQESPVKRHAGTFERWYRRLTRLQQGFQNLEGLDRVMASLGVSGPPRVPAQCRMLHSFFGQALNSQTGAAREVAAAMAAQDISRVTQQMGASRRTQELLNRADAEFGAVCELYKVGQWYHIKVVPGTVTLPPVLPR